MAALLRTLLTQKNGVVRLCEVHDRTSIELVRSSTAHNGENFDGVWISGLTQTTSLGLPDSELISPLKRALSMTPVYNPTYNNERQLCAAFDADSGGELEEVPTLVSILAINGISMIVIEDKALTRPGEKVNSLLATSDAQSQADMHDFANVIRAFKDAALGKDILITARIESFTTRRIEADPEEEHQSVQAALQDALARAEVYSEAGVDAIMIHSKSKEPEEVIGFLGRFRERNATLPLVVVPTAYSKTERSKLATAGANVFIYANHLMRAKIKAAAETLENVLAKKSDLFLQDSELRPCVEARNYGYLLRKLAERRYLGEGNDSEAYICGLAAEKKAVENMRAVVKDLAGGRLCGCEADERIISVKELLSINERQVSPL
jgi:2-methylisocitrate lyase-like PEP mutase family enzyme